ncbi:MAG TPA: SDR family NAD(P)-dependent oxidoreductase, partial [Solirubrobacteraceae bacterium]
PSASSQMARSVGRVAQSAVGPLLARRSLQSAVDGRTVMVTGASSGIGRAAAVEIGRAGGTVLLVARTTARLKDTAREIEASHGLAEVYRADLSAEHSIDALLERVLAEHPTIDVLVNNAGRSIRRSLALSYDRFHDFERTMQLNYFGPVKLILGLLPGMRERRGGQIVNVSTLSVQTNAPRFSAYIASKAALDAFTRVAAAECADDGVQFTTIHMPLVRTAMSAPTKLYDRFPALTPEQAAQLICDAIRTRADHVGPHLGAFTELGYAISPAVAKEILGAAYRAFPDSAAARGKVDESESASALQRAVAQLLRGAYW